MYRSVHERSVWQKNCTLMNRMRLNLCDRIQFIWFIFPDVSYEFVIRCQHCQHCIALCLTQNYHHLSARIYFHCHQIRSKLGYLLAMHCMHCTYHVQFTCVHWDFHHHIYDIQCALCTLCSTPCTMHIAFHTINIFNKKTSDKCTQI